MASLSIKTNLNEVNEVIRGRVEQLANPETILRPLCFDLMDLMTKRIHIDGIASSGRPIGTYSNRYLRFRQKKHQRTADSKIIVSLTRQLENDWSVIATPQGYGLGFLNPHNLEKARWVEAIKKVKIFSLTKEENQYSVDFINDKTYETLNGTPSS